MNHTEKTLVTRSSMPTFEEYCSEIRPLWDTHWLTNRGVKHQELENELQSYLGVEYATLFVNGHSALECILETMELGSDGRNEVITTPFTFASTTHAIVRKGLKPVFCDIKPDDYTMDPLKIESLVTNRTCAILPVHVYGNVCDTDAIQRIAVKYGLKVIYDAAHAFGVKKNGIGIGNFGDASMFSFHATKVFNTIEGGAICHSDGDLCDKLSQWRNFSITGPESVEYVGGNAKMNEFCAAMGLCNLRHLSEEIEKRRKVAERYSKGLSKIRGIGLCTAPGNIETNYAYYPVTFLDESNATRNEAHERLSANGISARKYFYPLVSDYACYRQRFSSLGTPIAKQVANRILTLPMYADLPLDEVDRIVEIVKSVGGR